MAARDDPNQNGCRIRANTAMPCQGVILDCLVAVNLSADEAVLSLCEAEYIFLSQVLFHLDIFTLFTGVKFCLKMSEQCQRRCENPHVCSASGM